MISDKTLIHKCMKNDSDAQELLYRNYASKMYGVCLRFTKNKMDADDTLQDGFIKVFNSLRNYKYEGSFEGWIRRIMINTAINHYKKSLHHYNEIDVDDIQINNNDESALDRLSAIDLLKLIKTLPDGYRMVFNLYAIEGYNHIEVGKMLGISKNTSKSQLSRARKFLQDKIKKNIKEKVYERTA